MTIMNGTVFYIIVCQMRAVAKKVKSFYKIGFG
jgi:hypothetical protein